MQQLTKEAMKKALSEMPTGFENEDTVIVVEDEGVSEDVSLSAPAPAPATPTPIKPALLAEIEPPPLPFTLMRKKMSSDEAWLASLSPAARAILERAAHPAPSWPFATRIPGAIAMPAQRIPKLAARVDRSRASVHEATC